MATADEYAAWLVGNASRRGTPEFDTVALAYEQAKAEERGVRPGGAHEFHAEGEAGGGEAAAHY